MRSMALPPRPGDWLVGAAGYQLAIDSFIIIPPYLDVVPFDVQLFVP